MLKLGTILYLKEGTEKLMIINRQILIEVNNNFKKGNVEEVLRANKDIEK